MFPQFPHHKCHQKNWLCSHPLFLGLLCHSLQLWSQVSVKFDQLEATCIGITLASLATKQLMPCFSRPYCVSCPQTIIDHQWCFFRGLSDFQLWRSEGLPFALAPPTKSYHVECPNAIEASPILVQDVCSLWTYQNEGNQALFLCVVPFLLLQLNVVPKSSQGTCF